MGVQLKTPVAPLMPAPAGAPIRVYVKVFLGSSLPISLAVKLKRLPSLTVLLPMATSTGAWLTSLTVTVIDSSAWRLGLPLSVIRTMKVYEPGPWASVGVQLKTPVAALMPAPEGAPIGAAVIRDPDREGVRARPLGLDGRPTEDAGGAVDAGSRRRTDQGVRQGVPRQLSTDLAGREAQEAAFIDCLIADGGQHRRLVD